MDDPTPNDLRQPIDTRSLNARAALRGALGGFCWSLLVAVPGAWMAWATPLGGPVLGLFAFVATCSIWTVIAAFVNVGRTHERLFPQVPRQPIDTRSLIAQGALRGAFGGFCWSLVVGVPAACSLWNIPNGGPIWGLASLGLTSLVWTGIAALVGASQTREQTFTDEQRAVLRRRVRRSALQGLCFSLPVAAFLLVTNWGYGAAGAISSTLMLVGIWVGSAALVGHGMGRRTVRAMQRETRAKAEQLDLRMGQHDPAPTAEPSKLVQPDLARLSEMRQRASHHPIDAGLED